MSAHRKISTRRIVKAVRDTLQGSEVALSFGHSSRRTYIRDDRQAYAKDIKKISKDMRSSAIRVVSSR